MLSRFLNYFRDEEDSNPSFIQMTRNILIFVILINLFLLPLVIGLFGEESRNIPALFVLSINLILEIISLYYAIRGKVGMAKLIQFLTPVILREHHFLNIKFKVEVGLVTKLLQLEMQIS